MPVWRRPAYKGGHGGRAILRVVRRRRGGNHGGCVLRVRRGCRGGAGDIDDVDIVIAPKSHEELLGAMYTGVPSSVYVDGERISGPVFKARLENALGIPVRQPRIVRLYLDPE
jgi:hypothetical protein